LHRLLTFWVVVNNKHIRIDKFMDQIILRCKSAELPIHLSFLMLIKS